MMLIEKLKKYLKTILRKIFILNNLGKMAEWPFASGSVTLDVCEICNQVCSFCDRRIHFLNSGKKPRAWTGDHFKKALPRLNKEIQISFAGGLGEPLLNKDLPQMLWEIKKANSNIKVQVLTNGLTLIPELCDEIIDFVDILRISLIAITAKTHNKLIDNSNFEKIQANLEYLKVNKPKSLTLIVSFIGMRDNIAEFPKMVEWAGSLGIDQIILQSLSERGLPSIKGQSLVRHPKLLAEKWSEAKQVAKADGRIKLRIQEAYKAIIENKEATIEEVNCNTMGQLRNSTTYNLPRKGQTRDCLAPFNAAIIDFEGRIVPCCSRTIRSDENFGNLFDEDFRPIKQTKYFIELRRALLTGELPDYCKYCNRAPLIKTSDFQRKIADRYLANKNKLGSE